MNRFSISKMPTFINFEDRKTFKASILLLSINEDSDSDYNDSNRFLADPYG
jgi:hypothetical protein